MFRYSANPLSERCLSLVEREEIARLKVQGHYLVAGLFAFSSSKALSRFAWETSTPPNLA